MILKKIFMYWALSTQKINIITLFIPVPRIKLPPCVKHAHRFHP
jgi:hypothetical protein